MFLLSCSSRFLKRADNNDYSMRASRKSSIEYGKYYHFVISVMVSAKRSVTLIRRNERNTMSVNIPQNSIILPKLSTPSPSKGLIRATSMQWHEKNS